MSDPTIKNFITECHHLIRDQNEANECAHALAPVLLRLVNSGADFLEPAHLHADPEGYVRNSIYVAEDGSFSLSTLIFSPGFWSPIHDHNSWGLIGVLFGVLEEREFEVPEVAGGQLEYVDLHPSGIRMFGEGSVFTHLPAETNIHRLGVPEDREPVVCLHLQGPELTDRFVYHLKSRTREMV